MTRPLIGITTYPPGRGERYNLPVEYVESVRRSGATAVLIPPGDDDPAEVLDRIDGLVLSGGGDLDPALYGGAGHETIYGFDAARDTAELALARAALDRHHPTLAICRGHQVVNVALGGSLVTHLPDVVSGDVLHRIEPPEPQERAGPTPHPVTVEPGTRLAEIMGSAEPTPVSWHHQAVDRLGDGLRVIARAPDGTVEAVDHPDFPQLVSVQWHPELSAATDVTQQRLFDDLAERAASRGDRSSRSSDPGNSQEHEPA